MILEIDIKGKNKKILPVEGGGATTIRFLVIAYELVAVLLHLEVSFGTMDAEDQNFQIFKEIQKVQEKQWQRNSNWK